MAIIHLPNGIGDTLGDTLVTTSPLEVNGNVWYVHFTNGTDAASPAGQNRQDPLKTLGQAHTNAANGDIIVLMDGHEETLTATVTISKAVVVVGAGSSGGYPTAKLTNNQAAGSAIAITAAGHVELRNIWFEEESQANTSVKISVSNASGSQVVSGCYVRCGQYDDDFALEISNTEYCFIKNSTFLSVATSVATQPLAAIALSSSATVMHVVYMDGVVVDGGTHGWSNYWAVDISQNTNNLPDHIIVDNLSLLRGSDMRVDENAVGYINASTQTGGCRIDWDGVT